MTTTASAPSAVYLRNRTDPWCADRRGVWWPALGLWVDRLEVTTDSPPPADARTYPLIPPAGANVGAVHGQVDDTGVAHVLVTSKDGDVITQASVASASAADCPLLVLATLVAAVGEAEEPAQAFRACATDRVLTAVGTEDWVGGWSLDTSELPGKVLRVLSL